MFGFVVEKVRIGKYHINHTCYSMQVVKLPGGVIFELEVLKGTSLGESRKLLSKLKALSNL